MPAQDGPAVEAFRARFEAAIGEFRAADTPAALRAVRNELQAIADAVDTLPVELRARTRFWVAVRLAEVLARGVRPEAVREQALATREAAVRDGVYDGYHRVLLLVLLWQCLPYAEYRTVLAAHGEEEFLLADTTLADVRKRALNLEAPLGVLRADVLERRGRLLEAVALLQRFARELRDADGELAPWKRIVAERLARVFWVLGDLERAEIYLADVPDAHNRYWRAHIAIKRRDYDGAEREARTLLAMVPGPERPGEVALWHLLGDALESRARVGGSAERFDEALAAYRRAASLAVDAGDGQAEVAARNGVADCLLGLGRIDEAEREYLDVLARAASGGPKFAQAECAEVHKDLGRLHERRGDATTAFASYRRALEAIEEARAGLPIDALGNGFLEPDPDFILPAVDGVLRTAAAAGADPWLALALMDRCKARGLLDWLRTPPRAADPQRLRDAVRELALTDDPRRLPQRLRELEATRSFEALSQPWPLDPEALRGAVQAAEGALFLSYWAGQSQVWLIAASGGGAPQLLVLGAREAGLRCLRAAREAVVDPHSDSRQALADAAAFYLPDAVRPLLANARLIVYCPDTELSALPFEALPFDGSPLGIARAVEWAPSLAVRGVLATRAPAGAGALVLDSIRAPAAETALPLDPLRFSAIEGERVAAQYGSARRLREDGATLSALREALQREPVDVVHVSGHAFYDPHVPSASLLLLADGLASMQSLLDLPLRGASVVLSNCITATGEAKGGEGVLGVSWGPLAAGARAVFAAHWSVNQQATADLMTQLHHHRAAGAGDAEALRAARERLAAAPQYAHPYYWAGFSVFGPGAPADAGARWPWWVVGALVVVALVALAWRRARRLAS